MRSLAELPDPTHTAVSVITGPKVCVRTPRWWPIVRGKLKSDPQVTLGVVEQAKALGVPALWLQPGTHDENVVKYIEENGLSDKVIYDGPCVLVEGPALLSSL